MFKKTCVIFSVLIVALGVQFFNTRPIFKDYGQTFEVYLQESSSLARIKRVTEKEFFFLKNVCGESVSLEKEDFDLDEFLSNMNARIIFVEQTDEMNIYYAYSPNVKYQKMVDGRLVNVQIAIAKERVTVGSPLIFGSF